MVGWDVMRKIKRRQLRLVAPGEVLLEDFMRPLGISQEQLARDIDVPAGRSNEIVRGRRAITADTALRLAKYFGTSAEVWLGLQMEYELRRARRETWPAVEPRVRARSAA